MLSPKRSVRSESESSVGVDTVVDVRPADVEVLDEDFNTSLFEFRLGRGGGGATAADALDFVTPKSAPNDIDELTADNVAFVFVFAFAPHSHPAASTSSQTYSPHYPY